MTKAQLMELLDSDGGDDNQDVQIYVYSPRDGYAYFDVGVVTNIGPVGEHGATGTILEIGEFRTGGS